MNDILTNEKNAGYDIIAAETFGYEDDMRLAIVLGEMHTQHGAQFVT